MTIPFLDLQAQYRSLQPDIDKAIQEVLDSSTFALGPHVEAFEKTFASYCGVRHCIGVNSGTAALTLLMRAYEIGESDEVITATNSFFASAEAISLAGATPVLVDVLEKTANMNPDLLEAAITEKTKAILPVHLYGQTANMDAILDVARAHDVLVFEDAAQAHGAEYRGKKAGALAHGAALSFYPGKNLGAYGEGGAVITDDEEIAKKTRMLRDHGSSEKYHHQMIGYNERMDGIQGAVLGLKLQHLDTWNNLRRKHAAHYRDILTGCGDICFFETLPECQHAYHLLVIRTAQRDGLQKHLKGKDIATGIHYPIPIHLQPAYRERGWKQGDFPIAEKLAQEILSLPLYPEMKGEQIDVVCAAIRSFF